MPATYAKVAISLRNRRVDRLFTYAVPEQWQEAVAVGQYVNVTFGRRQARGVIVELGSDLIPAGQVQGLGDALIIKDIEGVLLDKPCLTAAQVDLARWLAQRYICPLSVALSAMIQAPVRQKQSEPDLAWSCENRKGDTSPQTDGLLMTGSDCLSDLSVPPGRGNATERSFVENSDSLSKLPGGLTQPLTNEQAAVLVQVLKALAMPQGQCFLLHGVTGSGKTRVYLEAACAVASKRQVLVLVPEIALVEQVARVFRQRPELEVVTWHSELKNSVRKEVLARLTSNQPVVVVGTRSALFLPLVNLGLVVMDEEHDAAYKQEISPRYHAREVALELVRRNGGVLLLGSATPSLESYYEAGKGCYHLVKLNKRIGARPHPVVEVVDLRSGCASAPLSLISYKLQEEIAESLASGSQVLLFLNRRGLARFVVCRRCGKALYCPRCDVTLTFHGDRHRLLCHYCGVSRALPPACLNCSGQLKGFGAGTERLQAEVSSLFPGVRVHRLDRDAVRKTTAGATVRAFEAGEADILVGTQMLAQGLHFPQVSLVGIIAADLSLNLPDFRARERTFQLLTQVAGRAGRGVHSGKVIIQTFLPNESSISAVREGDWQKFYTEELARREKLDYPPYVQLLRIVVSGQPENRVMRVAGKLAAELRSLGESELARESQTGNVPVSREVQVLGPAQPPVRWIKGHFRWHVLLKGKDLSILRYLAQEAIKHLVAVDYTAAEVGIITDVNPLSPW